MEKENETMHLYEGMYILSSALSDDARSKALQKILDLIEEQGGKVLKLHEQGRQRLAYDVRKHREGHYYIVYFEVPPGTIKDMQREYHLMEDLLRFITLRTEKVMEEIKFKSLVEQ